MNTSRWCIDGPTDAHTNNFTRALSQYTCINMYARTCLYVYTCSERWICLSVEVYTIIYTCTLSLDTFLCTYLYIYIHTCIYRNQYILLSVRLNTDFTRALSLYTCVHIYTEIPKIYRLTYREIDIVDYECVYIHMYLCRLTLYLYTFLCTYIYMYTRTYIVDYRLILYRVTEMHKMLQVARFILQKSH